MTFRPSVFGSGKSVAAFTLAMAVLGGCAIGAIEQPTIARVAPGDERILFAAEAFKDASPLHVKFTDPWQREDYALFKGNGAQAEILYATITEAGYEVALEYLFIVDRSVMTWNLNRKGSISWGEAERFQGPFSEFFYMLTYMQSIFDVAAFGGVVRYDITAPVCKTDIPGSNPGAASSS